MLRWANCIVALTCGAGFCSAQETPVPLTFQQRVDLYQRSLMGPGPVAKSLLTAGLKQWRDSPHEWGQGMSGYGRRVGYRYGTRLTANSLEFGVAALIGEDPRYFRSGRVGLARVGHAVKSTVVAPVDGGGTRIAYARFAGAFGGAALSNAWYPDRYRTVGRTLERAGLSLVGDMAGNIFREFWPDIKRKFLKR